MSKKISDSQFTPFNINQSILQILDAPQGLQREAQQKVVKANLPETNQQYFMGKEVPIYKVKAKMDRVVLQLSEKQGAQYFAHGELIGKFYQSNNIQYLSNTSFIGEFEGIFQWVNSNQQITQVFFQGYIHNLQLITKQASKPLQQRPLLIDNESSFHGYFKGHFFPWSLVGGKTNIFANRFNFIDEKMVPQSFHQLKDRRCNNEVRQSVVPINEKTQYFLPTLVRFQILNVGDINLQKSRAVVNGNLYLQVKYNQEIQNIVEENRLKGRQLSVALTFNRDVSLMLPLYEEEDGSQDSQWSIQQKTWDIQFQKDQKRHIFKYKILKRFKTEIDNSYGAFFAPFNLSKLVIVVTIAPIYLDDHIKINFTCVDTEQFKVDGVYDPFAPFIGLADPHSHKVSSQQINRIHKINRNLCNDNGQFLIADNYLTIYSHFKNILQNTGTTNQDWMWNLGLKNCRPLFEPPLAKNLFAVFNELKNLQENGKSINQNRFFTFSFLKWNHAVIQIPTYKYIVIDMIKVFVPLTLITIISLFIFEQENGIGQDSKQTTLAYRLVNIASLVIVFVSMIPIIRSSLPKMPSITLIQIITYLEIIPSFFAVINSMKYYDIPKQSWRKDYKPQGDALFSLALFLSATNLLLFIIILVVYKNLDYRCKWVIGDYDEGIIRWKSPLYIKFIESVRIHKKGYYDITQLS